jgi:hypothetical protein
MLRTRLLVAGLFVAAACSSSDTTLGSAADEATITADVAAAAADGAAEDVDVMTSMDGSISASLSGSNAGAAFFASPPGDWRPGLTGCSFAGGSFTCPSVTRNGLAITRTITLLDAGGATQSAYDALLTASIHLVADISGDRTHGPWSGTVARHRDITITGLAGTETSRTVNGTGSETASSSRIARNDSTRSYSLVGSSVATNVVLPVRSSDGGNGWPTSGTITRTFTVTLTSGPHSGDTKTRTVTITFNGTSSVTGTVNGTTFTIDLSAHTATHS